MPFAKTMRSAILALLVTVVAAPAARADEGSERLQRLRAERQRHLSDGDRLAREQAALEQALVAVNEAIRTRKALGVEVVDAALEDLLRKHREISERLTELSRAARASALRLLVATQVLVDALDREITRLGPLARRRGAKGRVARAALRALLAERGRLALGPVGGGCVLPDVRLSPADGPEEARAKANLLKDAEDRCRRRIERVEKRLGRLREEKKLLREAADFREEGEIFDEESQKRIQTRVQTVETTRQPPPPSGRPTPEAAVGDNGPLGAAPGAGPQAGGPAAPPATGGFQGDPGTAATSPTTIINVLRQAQVDATLGGRPGSLDEEMSELTRKRLELRGAANRIQKAYQELLRRADEIQRKR